MMAHTLFTASSFVIASLFTTVSSCLISDAQAQDRLLNKSITNISALESSWDWGKYTLTLTGKVSLSQGELFVKCAEAVVIFAETPFTEDTDSSAHKKELKGLKIISIKAHGEVSLKYKQLSISADKVHYSHREKHLRANGRLRGRWRGHRISGRSLSVSLKEEKLRVQRLKMGLDLSGEASPVHSLFGR